MMGDKYRVIKDFIGLECNVYSGDILIVEPYEQHWASNIYIFPILFKNEKAVCEVGSLLCNNCCKII